MVSNDHSTDSQSGAALITALVIVALMGIAAVAILDTMRFSYRVAVNTAQRDPPGGHIFLHASTREKVLKLTLPNLSDANAARETAKLLASRAHEMGQTLFTYERGKQRYMGKVKVVLDTLREHGIRFVSGVDSRKSRDYSAADAAPAPVAAVRPPVVALVWAVAAAVCRVWAA